MKIPIVILGFICLVLTGIESTGVASEVAKDSGFFHAFVASFLLILGSEVGDKTFFIAAILSMKHPQLVVFLGAIGALVVMTALSAGLGVLLPTLLSKEITHIACICLFAFFGIRLLYDVYTSDREAGENEELKEVELELSHSSGGDVEGQARARSNGEVSPVNFDEPKISSISFIASVTKWWQANDSRRVFVQAFGMTFLAEWGDRSQIATIALASAKDAAGVTLGGIVGHCLCTGLAVIGGKLLASKISERHVNLAGGCLFIIFALASVVMGPD